jgi:hypothetical protein
MQRVDKPSHWVNCNDIGFSWGNYTASTGANWANFAVLGSLRGRSRQVAVNMRLFAADDGECNVELRTLKLKLSRHLMLN